MGQRIGAGLAARTLVVAMLLQPLAPLCLTSQALAIGVVSPVPMGIRTRVHLRSRHQQENRSANRRQIPIGYGTRWHGKKVKKVEQSVVDLPALADKLSEKTIAPGVIYKYYRGPLSINVIDVDMMHAPVEVRPVLAGDSFNQLADVQSHARKIHALAAVNANYFKRDGTPLGTLIMDGEWVSGSLYDRVSLGINPAGYVRIDRVNTHGLLETSNPDVPKIWVNTVNQPHRSGSHLIVYTRRWGSYVQIPYAGCLVAINGQGEVVDQAPSSMSIPYGGYVLCDSKAAPISALRRGDLVHIDWQTSPESWKDVMQAVSGGPMLIKDGNLFIDVNNENFHRNWTGSQIHARTAVGITESNHLLMATIEGPHTLWDFAKFLRALGAVDAMNLDGGGSTTMVVEGKAVTRNGNEHERRVASSLAVVPITDHPFCASRFTPHFDLTDFCDPLEDELPDTAESQADNTDKSVSPIGQAVDTNPKS